MIERARVVEIKNGYAKLEIRRVSACGDKCSTTCGGCAPTNTYVEAINRIGAKIGDFVEVELNTRIFLTAVLITYGLPMLMLFVGIFTGSTLLHSLGFMINGDLAGVMLGFALMAMSFFMISRKDKKYSKNGKIQFEIIKVL